MSEGQSKPIPGFPDYAITNNGEVRSFKQKKVRVLKAAVGKNGYPVVSLWNNNSQTMKYIHRLLAESFIPNPNNHDCVNHKNGNRCDNRLSNLEWVTYSENNQHSYTELGKPAPMPSKGVTGHRYVVEICHFDGGIANVFPSAHAAARSVRGNQALISNVCKGVNKSGYGRKWRYATEEEIKTQQEKVNG